WPARRGFARSDAVNARVPLIQTTDRTPWTDIGERVRAGQGGEAAFAASGTCVATQGRSRAWVGTGGAAKARILATTDGGHTWAAYDTPIVQGTPSSGVFSVDFRDPLHGILGAGELAAPTAFADTVARSSDGGKTWQLTNRPPVPGAIYGLSYVRERSAEGDADEEGSAARAVVVTGTGGGTWSPDEGDTWVKLKGL